MNIPSETSFIRPLNGCVAVNALATPWHWHVTCSLDLSVRFQASTTTRSRAVKRWFRASRHRPEGCPNGLGGHSA